MPRRKKSSISLIYNRFTLLILVGLVGVLGITVVELSGKEHDARIKRLEAEREYRSIEERKEVLERDLHVLETPRGQEALVRSSFDVGKEGEEVIVVLDALPATSTPEETRGGFFSWFASLFK